MWMKPLHHEISGLQTGLTREAVAAAWADQAAQAIAMAWTR
jgi:hypothetical protein